MPITPEDEKSPHMVRFEFTDSVQIHLPEEALEWLGDPNYIGFYPANGELALSLQGFAEKRKDGDLIGFIKPPLVDSVTQDGSKTISIPFHIIDFLQILPEVKQDESISLDVQWNQSKRTDRLSPRSGNHNRVDIPLKEVLALVREMDLAKAVTKRRILAKARAEQSFADRIVEGLNRENSQ